MERVAIRTAPGPTAAAGTVHLRLLLAPCAPIAEDDEYDDTDSQEEERDSHQGTSAENDRRAVEVAMSVMCAGAGPWHAPMERALGAPALWREVFGWTMTAPSQAVALDPILCHPSMYRPIQRRDPVRRVALARSTVG